MARQRKFQPLLALGLAIVTTLGGNVPKAPPGWIIAGGYLTTLVIWTIWLWDTDWVSAAKKTFVKICRFTLGMAACIALLSLGAIWSWPESELVLPEEYKNALQVIPKGDGGKFFAAGSIVGGKPYVPGTSVVDMKFTTSGPKLFNVDLRYRFDSSFTYAQQISSNPNVTILPADRNTISGWSAGSIDSQGKEYDTVQASPDDIQSLNTLPFTTFSFRQGELDLNSPTTIVLLREPTYKAGNFTGILSYGLPEPLAVSGQFEVEYKGKRFKVDYNHEFTRVYNPNLGKN